MMWIEKFRNTAYSWLLGDFPRHKFPSVAIIPFENPDLYDEVPLLSQLKKIQYINTFIFGLYKNTPIAISSPKFGAPAVAMTLDVLSLTPVQTIIGIGYCGRLNKNIACGDIVIPISSYIDEGTSRQYGNKKLQSYASGVLIEKTQSTCNRLLIKHHVGLIWSTDGILRETDEKLSYFSRKKAIVVDMESSAAFTVGRHFNKSVASILVGSDNPLSGENMVLEKLRTGYANAVKTALETLHNL
ncbi:hypothetical protein HYW87_02135 [Candidatus Roizmanbacteria bacterium]|nr:hypothetical protein [Candidatus Roizmanbacteria bacterium]